MLGGSVLLTLMTLCMSVWVFVCGQWYLGVFSFCSVGSDYDCCVKWLSSVQSDIHANVFPLFFLCRVHWDTWDTSGRDACFVHWSTPVDQQGGGLSRGQASTFFFSLHKALMALNHQETSSSKFILWLPSTERPPGTAVPAQCYCETGEGWRAATVCAWIQICTDDL